MLKISDTVRDIINKDARILEVIQDGILNFSAYAKKILPEVKKRTKKPVTLGSITVCLSRLARKVSANQNFRPYVKIDNYSVKSGLSEITFETSQANFAKVAKFAQNLFPASFLAFTTGIREITVICQTDMKERLVKMMEAKPKFTMDNLVGISANFSPEYMDVPNAVYSLVSILALRRINLIEIVSTYTEVTFIIPHEELQSAIEGIESYCREK